jgi:hypothetical protein
MGGAGNGTQCGKEAMECGSGKVTAVQRREWTDEVPGARFGDDGQAGIAYNRVQIQAINRRRGVMAGSSLLRGVGVVVLAVAEMECGYRLVYWYWMTLAVQAQRQTAEAHFHIWLTAAVIVGLGWMYLSWTLLVQERRSSKKTIPKKPPAS